MTSQTTRTFSCLTSLITLWLAPSGLWAQDSQMSNDLESRLVPRVVLHGGIQLLDSPDAVDELNAFYAEFNGAVRHSRLPPFSLLTDLRAETLSTTRGLDESLALYVHVRQGLGYHIDLTDRWRVYGEAKAAFTWEWFRLNGEPQADNPSLTQSSLTEVGIAGRFNDSTWRLGVARDGHELQADRTPFQLRGSLHAEDVESWSWGINGRFSPDYLSLGLSIRFF